MSGTGRYATADYLRLAARIGLSRGEAQRLAEAGACSPRTLHCRIESNPSLLEGSAERRAAILHAAAAQSEPREIRALAALRRRLLAAVPGAVPPIPLNTTPAKAAAMTENANRRPAPPRDRPRLDGPAITLLGEARWRLREQGRRPTCIPFAVTAMLEHPHHLDGDDDPDLSEQYLFWAMKERSPSGQAEPEHHKLRQAMEALSLAGICAEADQPYIAALPDPAWATGATPSPAVQAKAYKDRWTDPVIYDDEPEDSQGPGTAARLLALLRQGRATAIALPMMRDAAAAPGENNWRSRSALLYGKVPDPVPGAVEDGGHAVCILGFLPHARERRGGYFLFRNSWGARFAEFPHTDIQDGLPPVGRQGYGYLSANYVDRWCWELLSLAPAEARMRDHGRRLAGC
ncbi:hypothetical protein G3576_10145 [Roseomonas stagni]|uniref:Peptidase C1A papain C-terminal domain-containing protein n=1 Tax=Falsiroseomonas algicola TaxID=2716930 RepID=A0A6M1LJ59_9PROT|nr:hypothetical protein [Falsiroseomonas algicola]NGM20375.1 hypothetical protein [Falsiroseomonas algicola]